MTAPVFADTCFRVALLLRGDQLHERATQESRALGQRTVVTTDMVLVELLNGFASLGSVYRETAGEFAATLEQQPITVVLPQDRTVLAAALDLYRSRPDRAWSLTDCASMLACRDPGIEDVLTYDRHFAQAGFHVLLGDPQR